MFKIKLYDVGILVLLTSMHVCMVLQPVIEANVNMKASYPAVDRSLWLQVSYKYNHWMLVKSIMYSMLAVAGLWYSRHLQGSEELVGSAEEVKNGWLSRNHMASTEGKSVSFPTTTFMWFAIPWILTCFCSGLINYIRLYLVIQHFCFTNWQIIQLYAELQVLFWRRLLAMAVIPYWKLITGDGGSSEKLSNFHENFITYETNLLN
ncbi:hypothetical protein KR054_009655 [Drosophila jambulina]|nr:hypothetical protein KR054_009655 [Drosophila jambulina]